MGTRRACLRSARRFGLDGILSNDSAVNPFFAAWTHAILWDCDGSDLLGDSAHVPFESGGAAFYLQGKAVALALVDALLRTHGLHEAQQVLLVGESAAGEGLLGIGDGPGNELIHVPVDDVVRVRLAHEGRPAVGGADPGAAIGLAGQQVCGAAGSLAAGVEVGREDDVYRRDVGRVRIVGAPGR